MVGKNDRDFGDDTLPLEELACDSWLICRLECCHLNKVLGENIVPLSPFSFLALPSCLNIWHTSPFQDLSLDFTIFVLLLDLDSLLFLRVPGFIVPP